MKTATKSLSLQSYAFQLRKLLISKCDVDELLTQHKYHQQFLAEYASRLDPVRLSFADRFAWKFLREINILSPKFIENKEGSKQVGIYSMGVYQDLTKIVHQVQSIWFPEMKDLPNVVWLKHFSTRKLAHYAKNKDEIAFSLIFDSAETPPEILNYLAYHELLHRQVGSKVVNGRRYHHTGEFKTKEQLFPNWRDIEDQIGKYISNTF
ncbi:MAG: hypothetical protein MJE63_32640 [Proteobacteria bacterium]|nr:hypothetical protein [Pseudomonadota bacterium]